MSVELHSPFRSVMPALSATQRTKLRDDLQLNGCQKAILVDEDDNILDGHHRYELCKELGIDFRTEQLAGLGASDDKRLRILSLNLTERMMGPAVRKRIEEEQKAAALIMLAKGRGVREVARLVGRPHSTIINWKREQGGQVDQSAQPPAPPEDAADTSAIPAPVSTPSEPQFATALDEKQAALAWRADGVSIVEIARRLNRHDTVIKDWIRNPTAQVKGRPSSHRNPLRAATEQALAQAEIWRAAGQTLASMAERATPYNSKRPRKDQLPPLNVVEMDTARTRKKTPA